MEAINIACHDIHVSGMTNIDIDPLMKPDLLLDCTRLLEHFKEENVDFVYAGHFLEHLVYSEGQKVVSDIYKILRTYGVFIATVPDYTKCKTLSITEAESVILAGGLHKSLMDVERLKNYFKTAGFLTVVEAKPSELAHCPFPKVEWQTSVIGIKHPPVFFHGIK